MSGSEYKTELLLASQGKFYSEDFPVKDGVVTIIALGTQEEGLIASGRLKTGESITSELIKRCVEPQIDPLELLTADRLTILLGLRIFSYGSYYKYGFGCPSCREQVTGSTELNKVYIHGPEDLPGDEEPFEFMLPNGDRMHWRLFRGRDEHALNIAMKNRAKQGKKDDGIYSYTFRVAKHVQAVNDVEFDNIGRAMDWVKGLRGEDAVAIRQLMIDTVKLGPDMRIDQSCPACDYERLNVPVPPDAEFFRPSEYSDNTLPDRLRPSGVRVSEDRSESGGCDDHAPPSEERVDSILQQRAGEGQAQG